MTDANDKNLIRALFVESVDDFAILSRNLEQCFSVQGKGDKKTEENCKEKKDSFGRTHNTIMGWNSIKIKG